MRIQRNMTGRRLKEMRRGKDVLATISNRRHESDAWFDGKVGTGPLDCLGMFYQSTGDE